MVIVGAFGVGTAMGSEHVAAEIANILLFLLSPFGMQCEVQRMQVRPACGIVTVRSIEKKETGGQTN